MDHPGAQAARQRLAGQAGAVRPAVAQAGRRDRRLGAGPAARGGDSRAGDPRRLVECLARIGGLAELAKHPATGHDWQWEPAEAQRIKFQIERDFKAAWMAVRKRELGGGV